MTHDEIRRLAEELEVRVREATLAYQSALQDAYLKYSNELERMMTEDFLEET